MEREYYEITSDLDAREILRYLNNLGIHNISGEVLKYFITGMQAYGVLNFCLAGHVWHLNLSAAVFVSSMLLFLEQESRKPCRQKL